MEQVVKNFSEKENLERINYQKKKVKFSSCVKEGGSIDLPSVKKVKIELKKMDEDDMEEFINEMEEDMPQHKKVLTSGCVLWDILDGDDESE